ncbi:MAG: metal-dependent hydrolase [Euryarchaeota archaeon]|nr:metal-dependent hydrolase [Euryarchaeota archaeon]MBU4608356.1 metal-dependent hydrolase [Euryarchaeota archaeon]MBV1729571.1 metal-dependent hydrolase [Methanobacterium sp.]MBV1754126.1 metal-dependent hydrolase [Methanobacterium sp.]
MRYYTHIAFALFIYILIMFIQGMTISPLGVFFAGWISVLPDIIERFIGEHRTLGHSIFWTAPLGLVALFNLEIGIALVVGFLSHILLDCCNTHASPLLYPLHKDGFGCFNKSRRIRTGTIAEKGVLIFIISLLITVLLFMTPLYHIIGFDQMLGDVFARNNTPPETTHHLKCDVNLNLRADDAKNKNITVDIINETRYQVLITDMEVEG